MTAAVPPDGGRATLRGIQALRFLAAALLASSSALRLASSAASLCRSLSKASFCRAASAASWSA